MFRTMTLTLAQEDAPPAASTPPANTNTAPGDSTTLAPSDVDGNTAPPPANPFGPGFLIIIVGMFAVMMIFSSRSQAKEKKKRQEMLSALKKGDKVETVGGILGAVVEVREHDVVLKVDENANTRIKFSRSAIRNVTTNPGNAGKMEDIKDTPAS